MFNSSNISSKFLNRMFRKIDGLKWDLQTGTIGVVGADGSIASLISTHTPAIEATSSESGTTGSTGQAASTSYNISVNPFDAFGMAIPAFATQVPFASIREGDMIVGDKNILGWVVGKTAATLKLLDFNGMHKTYQPPKVQILGQDGALVVQSLGGMFGGEAGVGGFQSALMPLLMLKGGDADGLDSILPLMLFSQMQTSNPAAAATAATVGGNPAAAANPMSAMMPMLMMQAMSKNKKSGKATGNKGGLFGDIDPMMLMMLTGGGLGGGAAGGFNPMMLLAMGGLGGDDADSEETPDLVSLPKSSARSFVPALQTLPARR